MINYSRTTERHSVATEKRTLFCIETRALPQGHFRDRIEHHLARPGVRVFFERWASAFAQVLGPVLVLSLTEGRDSSLNPGTFSASESTPPAYLNSLFRNLREKVSRALKIEMTTFDSWGRFRECGILPPRIAETLEDDREHAAVASTMHEVKPPKPTDGCGLFSNRLRAINEAYLASRG